ncbi:MAG: glycosyltransferase family 2 protein, partial [Chloroflexi bacterium]|nr:glycosyltransferase family 2 protein [Chloroflexota bacterium]
MIDLSVIIVSWNTRDLLEACLASLQRAADGLAVETLVVDNASADGSAAMVRQRFPQVQLIENTENVGYARANNQAIRQCTGRHVMLLNSDTVVRPGALAALVRFMDTHPAAGAAGPY